jgi:hypothetical protein
MKFNCFVLWLIGHKVYMPLYIVTVLCLVATNTFLTVWFVWYEQWSILTIHVSMRYEGLTPVNIKIMISDVTLCSVVVGYQCFRGTCFLHLQGRRVHQMGKNSMNHDMEERHWVYCWTKTNHWPCKGLLSKGRYQRGEKKVALEERWCIKKKM